MRNIIKTSEKQHKTEFNVYNLGNSGYSASKGGTGVSFVFAMHE